MTVKIRQKLLHIRIFPEKIDNKSIHPQICGKMGITLLAKNAIKFQNMVILKVLYHCFCGIYNFY